MKWFSKEQKQHSLARARDISALLPEILLTAQKITQSLLRGRHGRRRTGSGDHFWQYRQYDAQTDSASRIDWRRSARSDHLYVRELEDERPRRAAFWIDPSESLHYSSNERVPTKYRYGFTLSAILAYALTEAGEQIGIENRPLRASHAQGVARWAEGLMQCGTRPDFSGLRQTHIILASDFLDFDKIEIEQLAQSLKQGGNRLTVIVPVDPAEQSYPFAGHLKFESVTGGRAFETRNAKNLKDDYLKRFAAHHARIRKAFGVQNCFFARTDMPYESIALDIITHLREMR